MESKSGSTNSKSVPPIDSPKKDIVGVVSEEIVAGIRSDAKEDGIVEDGGGQISKDDKFGTIDVELVKSGFCRRCYIKLDMEADGRVGMWIDPQGSGRVVVDGYGMCEDCEYKRSIETDPNWGRSRRISSEERSCEEKWGSYEEKWEYSSDFEEVSSATPSKKKKL